MKNIQSFIITLNLLVFVVSSCSIEKRVHRSGFHIEWKSWKRAYNVTTLTKKNIAKQPNGNQIKSVAQSEVVSNLITNVDSVIETPIYASIDNTIIPTIKSSIKQKTLSIISPSENCDIITLKSSEEIKAKILEVGQNEIKYKKCDYLDGPTFTIANTDVYMIKFPNGTGKYFNTDKVSKTEDKPVNKPKTANKAGTFFKLFFLGLLLFALGFLLTPYLYGIPGIIVGTIGFLCFISSIASLID